MVVPRNSPLSFTVNSVDPDGDVYRAVITVLHFPSRTLVRRYDSLPAVSGTNARAEAVPPLVEGDYVWSASADDGFGGVSGSSVERRLTVTGPIDAGGGAVAGTLQYGSGGLRPGTCWPSTFDVDTASALVVVNLAIAAYAGPLRIWGSGASPCEDPLVGRGTVTLNAAGTAPIGSVLTCLGMTGDFVKAAGAWQATVSGHCVINGFQTPAVSFTVAGTVVPATAGAGVVSPVTTALLDGVVAVTPG